MCTASCIATVCVRLQGLYCQEDEPKATQAMDWSFDSFVPTKRQEHLNTAPFPHGYGIK